MILDGLCGPAILYIGFSLIQILIDFIKTNYENALIKFIIMIILTFILNILCNLGFSVISWFLVFIPIILMTITSTLTLRVFGLSPDLDYLQNNVTDISNNIEDLDNSNNLSNVDRINRDDIRHDYYDHIENVFNLNSSEEDMYDLSKNPVKYYLTDNLLNKWGDNLFIRNIINSGLVYESIKGNISNYLINLIYSKNSSTDQLSADCPPGYTSSGDYCLDSHGNKLISLNNNDSTDSDTDSEDNNESMSYSERYDISYGYLDGYFIYQEMVYNDFVEENPDKTDEEIDKLIEDGWNNLSASEQEAYNEEAEGHESTYNPYDLTSYRTSLSQYIDTDNTSTTELWSECPAGETKVGNNCISHSLYNSGLTSYS